MTQTNYVADQYTQDANTQARDGGDLVEYVMTTAPLDYCACYQEEYVATDSDVEDPNPDSYFPISESLKVLVSNLMKGAQHVIEGTTISSPTVLRNEN